MVEIVRIKKKTHEGNKVTCHISVGKTGLGFLEHLIYFRVYFILLFLFGRHLLL